MYPRGEDLLRPIDHRARYRRQGRAYCQGLGTQCYRARTYGGEEESVRYGEDGMPPPPHPLFPLSWVICAIIPVRSPAFDLKAEKTGEPTEMTHFLPSLLSFRKFQIYPDSIFSPPVIPLARTVLSPTWRKLRSYTLLPSLKKS